MPIALVRCSSFVQSGVVLSCIAVVFVLYRIYLLVYWLELELLRAAMMFLISVLLGPRVTVLNYTPEIL